MVYKIRLISDDEFNGYYYKGKKLFSKEGQIFTRKQLSTHLRFAINGAKIFGAGKIEVVEIEMAVRRTFDVDSLNDFKLIEKRDNNLKDLLNENIDENDE